jgi:ABC-type multidrug transport system fused ATPase/permease subunit
LQVLAAFLQVLAAFLQVLAAFLQVLAAFLQVLAAFLQVLDTFLQVLDTFLQVLDTFLQVLAAFLQVLDTLQSYYIASIIKITAKYENNVSLQYHFFSIGNGVANRQSTANRQATGKRHLRQTAYGMLLHKRLQRSAGGGYLTYQWYRSDRFETPFSNPNEADRATIVAVHKFGTNHL